VFEAGTFTTLDQRLISTVPSVFGQTCFNRLATHFNISMFGHQTMFDGVWSPKHFPFVQALTRTNLCEITFTSISLQLALPCTKTAAIQQSTAKPPLPTEDITD